MIIHGYSEEELKKFEEDLSAATQAQKQAIEAQTQEVLSSITAITAQDLSIKNYTDVVKKLTPAQRQQIKTLAGVLNSWPIIANICACAALRFSSSATVSTRCSSREAASFCASTSSVIFCR